MRSRSNFIIHAARWRRRGILLAEVMIALAMAVVLSAVLMVTMTKVHQAGDRMAEQRAAARAAEAGVIALQIGKPIDQGLVVHRVEGQAPAGRVWAEVTARHGGQSVSITGLVPEAAVGGAK